MTTAQASVDSVRTSSPKPVAPSVQGSISAAAGLSPPAGNGHSLSTGTAEVKTTAKSPLRSAPLHAGQAATLATDSPTSDLAPARNQSPATVALHAGRKPCPATGALVTPIVQSTTYAQTELGKTKGFAYSRVSNPTVSALEEALGGLEGTLPAAAYSSGLSAVAGLIFACCKAGDHVVCSQVIYGGTVRLLQQVLAPLGITSDFIDSQTPGPIAAAIKPNTTLVLLETPGNPTLALADVPGIAEVVKAERARRERAGETDRKIVLAVDNTFLTAAIFKPLDWGADISVYSTTKHIEGHNSAVGGALVTNDAQLLDRCRFLRKSLGTIAAPFDAWLTLRGVRTLPLRIKQHSRHAQIIAEWLEAHPAVERVNYPGLASHPQHELANKLHSQVDRRNGPLHGGVVSFELRGGFDAGKTLLNNVQLCALAEHVGSIDTILTHSASMTHADVPRQQRLEAGIADGLVRISVGLEDPADIIADLEQALAVVEANVPEALTV